MITLGIGKADSGKIPLKWSFSGSFVNTQSDTNVDGQKGFLTSGGFKGTLDPGTFQTVGEFVFSGPGTCPNGNPGFNSTLLPGTGHGVRRVNSTGDLIFTEISETICFDPATLIRFFSGTENITGGTGRFAGATGSITFSGTAKTLFEDAAGNFFGEFSGTLEGTIITP
ncbi:MAG: hypothetical protein AABN33_12615 [Acidobacteriota bacterium]